MFLLNIDRGLRFRKISVRGVFDTNEHISKLKTWKGETKFVKIRKQNCNLKKKKKILE